MPVELHPSQIRALLLREHDDLRRLASSIHETAQHILEGDSAAAPALHDMCTRLHASLCAHLDLEDAVLAPALRETDAFGPDRADALIRHHQAQRRTIEAVLAHGADAEGDPHKMAELVQPFVSHLLEDMDREDREVLHPNLLKDDPILVDGFTG
jgi:hypothetical protein